MSEIAVSTTSPQLTLFAGDSPVSPSRARGNGKASPMSDGCGPSSPVLFAKLGPDGCWLKMCRDCCQWMLDGSSEEYCETWPRSGTMQNGTAYRRRPLEHRTCVTECSSWPTPTVGDSKSARNATANRRSIPPTGIHAGTTLTDAVTMWPTMTAWDARTFKGWEGRWGARKNVPLAGHTSAPSLGQTIGNPQASGALNPTWVEWLMGFALGWTDLEPSGMQ